MYLSSLYQLWQFHNVLAPGQKRDGFDRLYVPQVSYITGDIDIHDIAIDKHGRIIFVNTLFCCLSTVSHTHSFCAGVEAQTHLQTGCRRPLPFERYGDGERLS